MISQFKKGSIVRTKLSPISKKLLEKTGILFAIFLAAILGNYIAHVATKLIDDPRSIYTVGIAIGLLVGMFTGIYMKRVWSKLFRNIQE